MIPNPGSKKALELGCLCPVIDNDYGNAEHFHLSESCALHIKFEEEPIDAVDRENRQAIEKRNHEQTDR